VLPKRKGPSGLRPMAAGLAIMTVLVLAGCAAPVRVSWQTGTEIDTLGFNLYRGDAAQGPFSTKVNNELIPASADPMAGGVYQFVDSTAQPGRIYFYRLEEVERRGGTNTHGPIEVRTAGVGEGTAVPLGGALVGGGLLAWFAWRNRQTEPNLPPDGQVREDDR